MHTVLERGLASSWSRQVGWTPSGSVHRVGGLLVALSGVADQTQQVAVVDGPVDDPENAVVAAEVLFAQAGWSPAFDLVAGAHPDVEQVLDRRGYRVVVERPGMVRRCASAVGEPDARVRAGRPDDRAAVVAVQRHAFAVHQRVADALLPPVAFDDPGALVLVAEDDGGLVGAVTVHVDAPVAGIVGAAVLPTHQRRGLGRALTDAAVAAAASHDATVVWLQATEAGLPVYLRTGFSVVGNCQVWLRRDAD